MKADTVLKCFMSNAILTRLVPNGIRTNDSPISQSTNKIVLQTRKSAYNQCSSKYGLPNREKAQKLLSAIGTCLVAIIVLAKFENLGLFIRAKLSLAITIKNFKKSLPVKMISK